MFFNTVIKIQNNTINLILSQFLRSNNFESNFNWSIDL